MNLTPDARTRERCESFARALMDLAKRESERLELEAADVRGVLFGAGIGAALEGGASVEDICRLVRTIARLKREADADDAAKR